MRGIVVHSLNVCVYLFWRVILLHTYIASFAKGDDSYIRKVVSKQLFSFYGVIYYLFEPERFPAYTSPLPMSERSRLNDLAASEGLASIEAYQGEGQRVWWADAGRIRNSLRDLQSVLALLDKNPLNLHAFPHQPVMGENNFWGDLTLTAPDVDPDARVTMTYFAKGFLKSPRYEHLVTPEDLWHDPELDWDIHIVDSPVRNPEDGIHIVRTWLSDTIYPLAQKPVRLPHIVWS